MANVYLLVFALVCSSLYTLVSSIRLRQVIVPTHKTAGETAKLSCRYDLEGDVLYSVKWYKGRREFFRYVPRDNPPVQTFLVEGITVDVSQSDLYQVTLVNLATSSSGRYKCEVSADGPSFQTSYATGDMTVIVLPKSGPEISELNSLYRVGHVLAVNCTSKKSKPAAALAWYINGKKVNEENLEEYAPLVEDDGLETSLLGLRLTLGDEEKQIQVERNKSVLKAESTSKNQATVGQELQLNCTAAIGSAYWQSSGRTVKLEYSPPQQKLMESRPAAATSGSGSFIYQQGITGATRSLIHLMARLTAMQLIAFVF